MLRKPKLKIPVSMQYNSETGMAEFKYVDADEDEFRNTIQRLFAPYFQKGSYE